nr:hypothetical protein [Tanacetum cinerariifolium]
MVNIIPSDHVNEVPIIEPNQHDDVLEPVLVDEDEDPEKDEFKEEEDPQEEEDDMEIDIEEDENEPKLTYPYEEVDPLNPPPPTSKSEPDDKIEVENPIEHEDETIPASVHEVGKSFAAPFLREDSDSLLPGLKKGKEKDKFYGKLILELGNEVHSSVEQGMTAMEKLVEKLGNTKDKVECKKLKKELEEARFSNIFLCMQNEQVERDLYCTSVRAHEFYQEMIHRGFLFEERLNKAINVSIDDAKCLVSEPIMPPKSAPMNQAAIRQMIKDSVDATIAAERARQSNFRNDANVPRPARGQDATSFVHECTFAGFMKCNPTIFCGVKGTVELERWFKKTKSVFEISECAEGKKVKFVAATLEGPALTWWKTKVAIMGLETMNQMPWTEMKQLMTAEFCPIEEVERMEHELDNIKGEVTSSKPADLKEAVRMAHKLMEQKSQARDAMILEGKKQKWESLEGYARAMVTAPTNGKLPLYKRCFTRHVGQCMIKCHKCGKVGHKARYCKEKSVFTGANAQPIWTCYDCGEQGHTRNRCLKKVKQEEVGEACGRAYVIKDDEPVELIISITYMIIGNLRKKIDEDEEEF